MYLKPILTLTHRYFPLNGHAAPSARAGRCWPGSNQALPIPICGPLNVRSASTSKGCWSRTQCNQQKPDGKTAGSTRPGNAA
jgi:5-methylcytosine-specific restriction endonuclease McrA